MQQALVPLLLACLASPLLAFRGRLKELPPPQPEAGSKLHEAQWFTQVLDHFNPLDYSTYEQRFWANWDNYQPGGPAFLMIGGEAEASPGWLNYGAWFGWAKEHGAVMFLLEHRYYGQSQPTEDMSRENMKFLSSRQALEDLANFINSMNLSYNLTSAPWVSFGGSYPGSLSAWLRAGFPHLVSGAVSSSGPLLAKLDFFEYLQVVEDTLDTTGPDCNPAISEALNTVTDMVLDEDNWGELSSLFHLCEPLDGSNDLDVTSFLELLIDNLAGLVQYNGRQSEDINSICSIMTDGEGDSLQKFAVVNEHMMAMYGAECLDHTYSSFLSMLTDTTWVGGGVGWRQWIWQTCTEFGWYQTTNQASGVYGNMLDLPVFERWCQDAFGADFTHEILEMHVAVSNIQYGGVYPKVDNVVFVHGSFDPWHAMGVLEDLSEGAPSIYITGTSHCADMYGNDAADNEELKAARVRIGELVASWVSGQE